MARRTEITPRGYRDLQEIWAYVARDNAGAADVLLRELFEEAESLVRFPRKGSLFSRRLNLRKLVVGNYSIVYRFLESEDIIPVFRFWHNARDPRSFRMREATPVYSGTVTQASP